MDTFFLVCAALGGTVIVLQTLAGMLGLGGDHDTDHGDADHGDNGFMGMLSVRTVAAAVTFFGLGGLTARYYDAAEPIALGAAVGAAAVAFYAVAVLIRSLSKLKADGTVRLDRAVGSTGSVYLRIPAAKGGTGKVHLTVQNRTAECLAVTAGAEIPTGATVRVVGIVHTDTVEVEPT